MFNDISCDRKGNKAECLANAKVVSIFAKKFGIGQWSFIGPGSEKKWYSVEESSPQGIRNCIADEMLLEFAESGCLTFRATTPLSRGSLKSKGHGKLSIHSAADQDTIWTIFRKIFLQISSVFTEQLQTCVKNLKLIVKDQSNLMCWWDNFNNFEWNWSRSSFDEWHSWTPESSIATIWRTNQIAFTRW